MRQNKSLESGNAYALRDLFGGRNKIVIPDLQRDYCWGANAWIKTERKSKGLVKDFVANIFDLFRQSSAESVPQMFGLIYGYEQPKNHIQVCDGQQRLTTMFILLGYINLKVGGAFDDYIISREERNDDFETRLQYAIRESTLYFLSDLSRYVFVEKTTSLSEVRDLKEAKNMGAPVRPPRWYFNDYDQDSSVQDILAALIAIDDCVSEDENVRLWKEGQWRDFGEYLISQIRFLYYDMGSRGKGEETYVVINTTGEPLSANENLKPILLGNLSKADAKRYSAEWETREQWFWENRGSHKTTDDFAIKFFVWYWQIGLLQERSWKSRQSYELNPRDIFVKKPERSRSPDEESASNERWETFRGLDNVQSYFVAFQKLVTIASEDSVEGESIRGIFASMLGSQKFDGNLEGFFPDRRYQDAWQLNVVLPCISYLVKFVQPRLFVRFLRRLRKNHFDSFRCRHKDPLSAKSGSYVDWRHVIQIVEGADSEVAVFRTSTLANKARYKNIPHVVINEWYSDAERDAEQLLLVCGEEVVAWEDHKVIMGDLSVLIVKDDHGAINIHESKRRWNNLIRLENSITTQGNDCDQDTANVANWYRLYRVVFDIVPIDHRRNTPWSIIGCHFAECFDILGSTFEYVSTERYMRLLQATDVLRELKRQVLVTLKEDGATEIKEGMSAKQFLKAALLAKVVTNDGRLIDTNEGYPISAELVLEKNKLNEELPLCYGNFRLAFGYKFGLRRDQAQGGWGDPWRLDGILIPELGLKFGEVPDEKQVFASTDKVKTLILKEFDSCDSAEDCIP